MLKQATAFALLYCVFSCVGFRSDSRLPHNPYNGIVAPKYEFRSAWIATVTNIDWPHAKGQSAEKQQKDFIELLEKLHRAGINAIFVQVRDAADAYYAKSSEPWSEWLTGKQGKAPEPFYDPLDFMIHESHKRNIEFHAWLNLNRAVFKTAKTIAPNHISRTKPQWLLTYDGQKVFNFGIPAVRHYITGIVTNLTKNYDIDGIHFDDYFYPYAVKGETIQDYDTFAEFGSAFKNIGDWRRNNIDLLVEQIHHTIEDQKPYVKFGISPFAVWRNKSADIEGSETKGGQTSYDNLFADTRKWLRFAWIDYIVPQIYFSAKHELVPYRTMTDWWANNSYGKHLYIGHAAYKMGTNTPKDEGWKNSSEMGDQIRYNRKNININGSVFFSANAIAHNKNGLADTLRTKAYRFPAIIPAMPWKDNTPPNMPQDLRLSREGNAIVLTWAAPKIATDGETAHRYIVYRFIEGETIDFNNPANILGIVQHQPYNTFTDYLVSSSDRNYTYAITALDRLSNESSPSDLQKTKARKSIFSSLFR